MADELDTAEDDTLGSHSTTTGRVPMLLSSSLHVACEIVMPHMTSFCNHQKRATSTANDLIVTWRQNETSWMDGASGESSGESSGSLVAITYQNAQHTVVQQQHSHEGFGCLCAANQQHLELRAALGNLAQDYRRDGIAASQIKLAPHMMIVNIALLHLVQGKHVSVPRRATHTLASDALLGR